MKYILVLFFYVILTINIQAQTTYYISNSQGNDSNTGTSESSPWQSLEKLHNSWGIIGPGDQILFKRGDVFSPSSISDRTGMIEIPAGKSGRYGNYIVLGAYGSGNKPIIDGSILGVYHNAVRMQSNAFIIIQDMEFKGGGSINMRTNDVPSVGIHHIKFLNIKYNGGGSGHIAVFNPPQGGYLNPAPNMYNPTHNIEIGYSYFENNGGEDMIAFDNFPGDSCWIHHNEFYNVEQEAIELGGGGYHVIEYNFISGCSVNGIKMHSQSVHMSNGIIRGNVVLKVGTGNCLVLWNASDMQIYNNTFYDSWTFAFGEPDDQSPRYLYGNFENNIIENNIFYGTLQVVYHKIGSATPPLVSDNIVFRNNIYEQNGESPLVRFWDSNSNVNDSWSVYDNNFNSAWVNRFNTSNEINGNPGLVNPYWNSATNYGNFSLAQGSSAINSGIEISGYFSDILGNAVPQDGITDMGAYEFNGVDITPPGVIGASLLNETTLLVSFSEPLSSSTANNSNNYYISNGVSVSSASLTGNQATLTTSAHSSGNFTVTVNNVQDLAGNTINSNNTASYSFNQDNDGPELVSVQINNATTVVVNFNEAVDQITAELTNNYSIDNEIIISSAVLTTSNEVMLTTSPHLPGNYTVTVINVRDISGNVINAQSNSANYFFNTVSDTLAISSYNFIQGSDANIIYDTAQEGDPVNLIIENLNAVSWLEPYGIDINSPTKILSKLPSNKITQACKQSNEITIEVWVRPKTLTQNGPARIVSLSADPNIRNFTLGQGESNGVSDVFDFRLRTTESNSNGLPSVTSQEGYMSASELNHFVYTHNSIGESRIYVNTIEIASEVIGGDFSNWDNSFHLIIGNEFTGDRPWLGEIYKLSIYNVALSEYRIDSLFSINLVTDFNEIYSEKLPSSYLLEQNYPNPFNPKTKIKFSLPETAQTSLKVYDTLGKEVAVLVNKALQAGNYSYSFNAENLSSGIYFYTFRSGKTVLTKKMLLLK